MYLIIYIKSYQYKVTWKVKKVYIAGIGMLTPVGVGSTMNQAAIAAGISAYSSSMFEDNLEKPITMACVPDDMFTSLTVDIATGTFYKNHYDRIIKMAGYALHECIGELLANDTSLEADIPLILAMPEPDVNQTTIPLNLFIKHTAELAKAPISMSYTRTIHTGRAQGLKLKHLNWPLVICMKPITHMC